MPGFVDQFGGTQIDPADVSYKALTFAANYELAWPPFAQNDDAIAAIMDVTASLPGLGLLLPDATYASPGQTTLIRNVGANNFELQRNDGTTIVTITPGQMVFVYLIDNTTVAGVWDDVVLGAGVATLDLLNSAGNGLLVVASRLAVSPIASDVAGDRTIAIADRATAFRWTGGTGTFTLPLSSSVGQFFFEVRNQGTGTLTLVTTGGEQIDASASIALQQGESAFVHAGTGVWFTVGRGRSTQFAFTQLQKTVTGGTVALTLTEAANVVQTYTGALTSNVDIVVPQVVQVYYVSNQTTGAFNFRVKTALAGTTVSIPTGQNAILFCDGTNVINASTTLAGISSLVFGSGSAASPSVGIGAINSGLFSPGSNEIGISANGAMVAKFDSTGITVPVDGGQVGVVSATGGASFNLTRPAGAYAVTNYYTGATQRWRVGVENSGESGANAGSNWFFEPFSDAGASLGQAVTITRSSGLLTANKGISAIAPSSGSPAIAATGVTSGNAVNATTGTGIALSGTTTGAGTALGGTTTGSTSTALLTDTGANGANLKLTGDGGVTPSKTIRVKSGVMEWMNNAYGVIASLTDAGTFTAVNVGISSDRRLKSNIRSTLFSCWRLFRLAGVSFTRGGKEDLGLIAQDVQKVYPELVNEGADGMLSVNYTGLVGELINAAKLIGGIAVASFAINVLRLVL